MPDPVPDWFWKQSDEILNTVTQWFAQVRPLPRFTIAQLPPANRYPGCMVYVSNGASNKYAAISNGSAWYYLDGTAV